MANLLKEVVRTEGSPKQWRQGLFLSLYKKCDAENLGSYRGITLLNAIGKPICKITNNNVVIIGIREGGSGSFKRSCVENIQGRMREGKHKH